MLINNASDLLFWLIILMPLFLCFYRLVFKKIEIFRQLFLQTAYKRNRITALSEFLGGEKNRV